MTETSEVKPVEAKIPSALACPEGDIFSLPSKEDIVNKIKEKVIKENRDVETIKFDELLSDGRG